MSIRTSAAFVQRNALSVTLLLVVAAIGLCVYSVTLIQGERAATILRECNAQNARHLNTVKQLDDLLKAAEKHAAPARVRQLKESRASTVLLINALAPYRNCQQVLAKST